MSYQSPSSPEIPAATDTGPVPESERIVAIDVLRGFALLGILVVNIEAFSMHDATLFNPNAYGSLEGMNYWVWFFTDLLFDQKFMTIFTILFGAGILLMTQRAEQRGSGSARLHYRRMTVLLVIGLFHAYLLWVGDILVYYAMCGYLVYLFRKRSAASLVTIGIASIAVASALSALFAWSMQFWPPESMEEFASGFRPSADEIAENLAAYRGGWVTQIMYRAPQSFMFQTFVFAVWGLWRAGGLMLVGMGLFKLGVLSAKRSPAFNGLLALCGLGIGIPTVWFGIIENIRHDWAIEYSFFIGSQYNYWASLLVSLGWVGLVMLVCRSGILGAVSSRLAAVGRMALSNYFLHTIICTTIFYGHGFGQYGRIERHGQILIVVAIWAFQLVVSPIWLRHFRFGPLEWVWRSLTYGRLQPMRRS